MGLALVMTLRLHTSVVKGLKIKVRKFWALISTSVEVTGGKLGGGGGGILNRAKSLIIDFFVLKFSKVILQKWVHFNQSNNVGRESFVQRLAIFIMLGTPFSKNLILIQTIFKFNQVLS